MSNSLTLGEIILLLASFHIVLIFVVYDGFMNKSLDNILIKCWLFYLTGQILLSSTSIILIQMQDNNGIADAIWMSILFYFDRSISIFMSMCLFSIFGIYYYIGLKVDYQSLYTRFFRSYIPCLFLISVAMLLLAIFTMKHIQSAVYVSYGFLFLSHILQFLGYLAVCKQCDLKLNESSRYYIIHHMGIIFITIGVFIGFGALRLCAFIITDQQTADTFHCVSSFIISFYYIYYSIAIRYIGQLSPFQPSKLHNDAPSSQPKEILEAGDIICHLNEDSDQEILKEVYHE